MHLSELFEAVRSSTLYHGTGPNDVESILYSNRMNASTPHNLTPRHGDREINIGQRKGEADPYGKVYGVSLTRSAAFARAWTSGNGVVLGFDEVKLRHRYRFVQIDYYNNRREAEEFLIGTLEPVSSYLTSISVSGQLFEALQEENDDFLEGHKPFELLLSHPLLRVDGELWNSSTGKIHKAA